MIKIVDPIDCCGCQACVQACPRKCISFVRKKDGFYYPSVDAENCIECGLCNKACPIENNKSDDEGSKVKLLTYAAISNDKQSLAKSSSGGVFKELAKSILADGGYVAGCVFDKSMNVCHVLTNDIHVVDTMRGSKYVQSNTADIYLKVKNALKQGRKVLFTGTPCQCAAARNFISKKLQANLYVVDFACHGVPSPVAWNFYLSSLKWDNISGCSMRDKNEGWEKFNFVISGRKHDKDVVSKGQLKKSIWIRGFLSHIYNRPSCYSCKFRNKQNKSDLTISDCWGARKLLENVTEEQMKAGISSVVIRTEKGQALFQSISKEVWSCGLRYDDVEHFNPALKYNHQKAIGTYLFFPMLKAGVNFKYTVLACCAIGKIIRMCKNVILRKKK